MLRFSVLTSLLSAFLCHSAAPRAAEGADTAEFRIASYIPETFTDFEWLLGGGFVFAERTSDWAYNYDRHTSRYRNRDGGSKHGNRGLDVNSFSRYRYRTVQRWLDISLDLKARLRREPSSRDDASLDSLANTGRYEREWSQDTYDVSASTQLDVGYYMISDFSVSGTVSHRISYHHFDRDEQSVSTGRSRTPTGSILTRLSRSDSGSESVNINNSISGEAFIGWGRVYEGEYAATALYMIEEVSRRGYLAGRPSRRQIVELTELVHRYRLGHGADERLYRIEALEAFVSYLAEQDLVENRSATSVLLIEDVWDYYPIFDRSFGFLVRAGLSGACAYARSRKSSSNGRQWLETEEQPGSGGVVDTVDEGSTSDQSSSTGRDHTGVHYFVVRNEYSRPLSAKWQLDCFGEVRRYIDVREPPKHSARGCLNKWEALCKADCLYMPDSRTSLLFSASVEALWQTDRQFYMKCCGVALPDTLSVDIDKHTWVATLGAGVIYRIAIPTTLWVDLSYERKSYSQTYPTSRYHSHASRFDLSASISHWLY